MEKNKDNRGGSRAGAGNKPKYSEPTEMISFRVPVSKIPEIRELVYKKLDEYKIN